MPNPPRATTPAFCTHPPTLSSTAAFGLPEQIESIQATSWAETKTGPPLFEKEGKTELCNVAETTGLGHPDKPPWDWI